MAAAVAALVVVVAMRFICFFNYECQLGTVVSAD